MTLFRIPTAEINLMQHPNRELLGLGIQQPWAELIVLGLKTIEIRRTPVAPKTIYLYASKKVSALPDADVAIQKLALDLSDLPRGMIVGTVDIVDCRKSIANDAKAAGVNASLLDGAYSWILENPVRLETPLKPRFIPYGMWFYPFQRRKEIDQ